MSESVARKLAIHGRVQGVFFRAFVREAAEGAGVTGWASNQPDGTVEAHLEGPASAVADVEQACGEGPPGAQVERVEARDAKPEGFAEFSVH